MSSESSIGDEPNAFDNETPEVSGRSASGETSEVRFGMAGDAQQPLGVGVGTSGIEVTAGNVDRQEDAEVGVGDAEDVDDQPTRTELDEESDEEELTPEEVAYDGFCREEFSALRKKPSIVCPPLSASATSQFLKAASVSGLKMGTGFQPRYCKPDDRGYFVRRGGKKAFFYVAMFEGGFRLPLHPFAQSVLAYYGIAASQLCPNSWRYIIAYITICTYRGWAPSLSIFRHLFKIMGRDTHYNFQMREVNYGQFLITPKTNRRWKFAFFGVKLDKEGVEWGFDPKWRVIDTHAMNQTPDISLTIAEDKQVSLLLGYVYDSKWLLMPSRLVLSRLSPLPSSLMGRPPPVLQPCVPLQIGDILVMLNGLEQKGRKFLLDRPDPKAWLEVFLEKDGSLGMNEDELPDAGEGKQFDLEFCEEFMEDLEKAYKKQIARDRIRERKGVLSCPIFYLKSESCSRVRPGSGKGLMTLQKVALPWRAHSGYSLPPLSVPVSSRVVWDSGRGFVVVDRQCHYMFGMDEFSAKPGVIGLLGIAFT